MQDLPKGWTIAELKDVGTYINGRAFKPNEWQKEGLPIVRIQNLNNPDAPFNYSQVEHEAKYKINNGDLLVAWSASLGVYIWSRGDAWLNQHIFRVEVNTELVTKETLYFLLKQAIGELYLKSHGTGMVHVTKPVFESHTVPLPPLNEQHRIVAKLEKLLSKVNSCGDRLDKIPTILKRFRQSVLAAACSGRLTADWREQHPAAPSWKKENLINLIEEKPRNGFSGKSVDLVDYKTNTKVLTLTATTSGTFRHDCFKYLAQDIPLDSHAWLHPADILIQRGNTIEYVGVSAIYTGEPFQFIYPDLMMKIRVKKEIADHRFIYFALSDIKTRNYFRDNATGTAGNMPKINQQVVMNTPIELPPLAEQEEIVRRVEALFQKCDQIEARYQTAKAYTDKLTQAILAKAFRGELVPQDPDDEPAEVLLERIKAEKAAATTKPQKTTKKRGKKASSPQQTIPGME